MAQSIYEAFAAQASEHPDLPACTDMEGELTYSQLDRLATGICAHFPKDGPGRVAIVMDHSVRMVASILATLRAGASYVPIEPDFPRRRMKYMLVAAGVDLVITDEPYINEFGGQVLVPDMDWVRDADSAPGPARPDPEVAAYVLFTSGSTGRPKGIEATNANVLHYARAFKHEFHIGPGDVMLQQSVATFDIFVEELFGTLLNGAELAVAPPCSRDNPDCLIAFMEEKGVTVTSGFPYLMLELNRRDELPQTLRLLISGGDILRLSSIDRLLERGIAVYNTYGPSETTVCATYQCCDPSLAQAGGVLPIGKAVLGAEVIVEGRDGKPAPPGELGEICIFGDGVTNGYLAGVDNSAFEAFPGRKAFRSGDLGYTLEDGSIVFVRRKDTQFMIDGRRVETGEVENVLCSLAGITAAHVLATEDEHHHPYLTAYIVTDDWDLSVGMVRRQLAEYLPSFMIPEFFVRMPRVPLTRNGKPDFDAFPVVMKEGEPDA